MADIRLSVASFSFHKLLESGEQDWVCYLTQATGLLAHKLKVGS